MQPTGELSFVELVLNASLLVQIVMFFLLALSILSWTIILQRSGLYKLCRRKAEEFEGRFWSGIDLNNLYQECVKRQQTLVGLEVIYTAGFKEFVRLVNSGPVDQEVVMDGTYRQMKVASSREIEALENHLPTLATIGSISPYIGLFGTVWGIMHAFVALGAVKNATLSMVAPPIAEALIATAMGLFAAIPAVMYYNRFVTKVEQLENRYLNFMDEFSTILNRRLVTIRTQLQKKEAAAGPAAADGQGAPRPRVTAIPEDPQDAYEQRPRAQPRRGEGAEEQEGSEAWLYRKPQPARTGEGGGEAPRRAAEAAAPAPGGQRTVRTRDGRQGTVNLDDIRAYPPEAKPAPIGEQLKQSGISPQRFAAMSRHGLAEGEDEGPHYITPGAEGDRERRRRE